MDTKPQSCNPEIWGGIECTINRVGEEFRDQLAYSGFYDRHDDLQKISSLGIKAMRFPILWEKHQQFTGETPDFSWARAHLRQLAIFKIKPIVGLLHHGCGPFFTSLHDEQFPEKLAAYALAVATEFPDVTHYTPVNEPLTTARFSGLYGLWYPHHKNIYSFLHMLLNQVKAIVLCMEAIRTVNPQAVLVQTEDLAKIHSTPELQYQADFENERRWLTYDLLSGKLNDAHPLWKYFIDAGIAPQRLQFFLDNPCLPAIAGFNYYITSERFLDQRLHLHPAHTHGGNATERYADIEAVQVQASIGVSGLLREAWQRIALPIALTEVHLGCTREEQMRWFSEVWQDACAARCEGIDVVAVTAWSLLGSFDWDSLLTVNNGRYETGVFELSDNRIRATAVSKLITAIALDRPYDHPVLNEKGWWQKKTAQKPVPATTTADARVLLILGKTGTLGHAFGRICRQRGINHACLSRDDINILDENDIARIIANLRPWAVINATGYVRVDDAEINADACYAVNSNAPVLLAKQCAAHGIPFMTFSTDFVFNGDKQTPYTENDLVSPINVYGKSKADGERKVLDADPGALIVRTSAFFGPWDKSNFAFHVLDQLQGVGTCEVVKELTVSPTYVPDLVHASLNLLLDDEHGIWHVSNEGTISWTDFATAVAQAGGYNPAQLVFRDVEEMRWRAPRPVYSVLTSGKGIRLPGFEHALSRYFSEKIY